MKFCSSQAIDPFPLSENHLCYSVSVLASKWLQHQTLPALCYVQIAWGLPNLFPGASFPHLEYVLKEVKKTRPKEGRSQAKPRLPITLDILKCLRSIWSLGPPILKHSHVMLWAACCLGFFGFRNLVSCNYRPT